MLDAIMHTLYVVGLWVVISLLAGAVVVVFSLANREPEDRDADTSDVLTSLHQSAARDTCDQTAPRSDWDAQTTSLLPSWNDEAI